jgi:Ca-activated chloride channel family protein
VDVLFVLDVTGSMQPEIDGICAGIADFAAELSKRDLDARIGLIAYRDRFIKEESRVLQFQEGPFTKDHIRFGQEVGRLRASGGGDPPESTLDALMLAARQPFNDKASKVVLLITDAPPHIPDIDTQTMEQAIAALRQKGIEQLHLVIADVNRPVYEPLHRAVPGEVFSLSQTARGGDHFSRVLPTVGARIAEVTVKTVKPLQASTEVGEQSLGRLMLAICVWTAVLAAGLSLALIAGQNHSLKRPWLTLEEGLKGGGGSIAAGLVAGAAGQLLFQQFGTGVPVWVVFCRTAGWALLGALLGGGMALFVKNLSASRALLGGALGGLAGALGFLTASALFGDVMGRLLGATLLGLCIGLMVALVEMAFRKAWLEVVYGPHEVGTVNLGEAPVSIGGDGRVCTVLARGAAPVAFRYRLSQSRVLYEDVVKGQTLPVPLGHRQKVGPLEVIVRGSAEGPPAAVPPRAETLPVATPALSPDRPYPAAAPARPPSPDRPYPAVTPAPAPSPDRPYPAVTPAPALSPDRPAVSPKFPDRPVATPAPATSKPLAPGDGCPGCGRIAPGLAGKRYCVVCDRTY